MKGRATDWWRRQRLTSARYKTIVYVARMSDAPELPDRRTAVIVGIPARPKWLLLSCPCGNAHRIALNLSTSRAPSWTLTGDEQLLTISPSIDSISAERRCHFWVRAGRVQWVDDSAVRR